MRITVDKPDVEPAHVLDDADARVTFHEFFTFDDGGTPAAFIRSVFGLNEETLAPYRLGGVRVEEGLQVQRISFATPTRPEFLSLPCSRFGFN